MSEVDEFLADVLPRFRRAERALHNGDPEPRIAMWSHQEPVTLFGASMGGQGWDQLEEVFRFLGREFSDCTAYENEVIAAGASGDLGYVVAHEHTTASVGGAEPAPYTLRVTTIYRREQGEWKVVHRHGDALASQDGGAQVRRLAESR